MYRDVPDSLLFEMLATLRRTLHFCPDAPGSEQRTARIIRDFLEPYDPDGLITGLGGHGVAAIFDGGGPGPTVMIRCELDAVPVEEQERGGNGVAHRCGHDGHMAMVAGLAPLFRMSRPISGRAVLLFQPSEETGEGAARVLEDPRFHHVRPDYAMALHNLPGYELGGIVGSRGVFSCASVGMEVELGGSPAHAAEPQLGRSPGLALSQLLAELPALAPQPDDHSRLVTNTHVRMGRRGFGVSPGHGVLCATLRARNLVLLDQLRQRAELLVRQIAAAHQLEPQLSWHDDFPETRNDDLLMDLLEESCRELDLGYEERPVPFGWSEDFGHFAARCPSVYFGLGIGRSAGGLHQEDYRFPDMVIASGVKLFYRMSMELLARGERRASSEVPAALPSGA